MMKNLALLVLIIVCSMARMAYGADQKDADFLTPDQMKEDLQFIHKQILTRHPNPYSTTPKAEFEKLYKKLTAQGTNPMSQREFYFIANRLVTAVGRDGHTSLSFDDMLQKWLPLNLVWIQDGMGILEAPDNPELEHSRVLTFNGETPEKWLEMIGSIRNTENSDSIRLFGQTLMRYEWIQQYFSGKDDIKGVTIKAEKNGKVFESFVNFVSYDQFNEIFARKFAKSATEGKRNIFKYWMIDELSAGYFLLYSCDLATEYFEAMDKVFEQVKEKGYRNVILDLAQNGGGDTGVIFGFLKHMPGNSFNMGTGFGLGGAWDKYSQNPTYWSKPSEAKNIQPFNGHVYVLIGQPTFSAANAFATVLKDNGLATLVGQKSSNSPCNFGAISAKQLPNAKFDLYVSSKHSKRPSLKCDDDALIPDVEVPLTLEDVLSGRDPVMEWLKQNLN